MRIFDVIAKRILSFALLMLMIIGAGAVLTYVLNPISYATYFNHDIDIMEKNNEKADILFIGASRVYRTYVPEVFKKELVVNCVVNAGSSSQPIYATYYQLKDLMERVHPDRVVIGVTEDGLIYEPNQQGMLIVYDRLSVKNKLQFALDCFDLDTMKYALYPYRFRENLTKIPSILQEKNQLIESDYEPDTAGNEYYADYGFVYSKSTYDTGTIPIRYEEKTYSENEIQEEQLGYLDACIELCQKNNADVILVTAPTSMMRIYGFVHYQEATDFYIQYAKQKGIVYYNLNYLKGREEFLPDELMHDYNHVNGEGAYVISNILADLMKKEEQGIDVSQYFYSDLEALKKDVHRIVAVDAECACEEDDVMHIDIVSFQNEDISPLYQVELSTDGGESYQVMVSWTEDTNIDVKIPVKENYELKIRAKAQNDDVQEAYQVYEF